MVKNLHPSHSSAFLVVVIVLIQHPHSTFSSSSYVSSCSFDAGVALPLGFCQSPLFLGFPPSPFFFRKLFFFGSSFIVLSFCELLTASASSSSPTFPRLPDYWHYRSCRKQSDCAENNKTSNYILIIIFSSTFLNQFTIYFILLNCILIIIIIIIIVITEFIWLTKVTINKTVNRKCM